MSNISKEIREKFENWKSVYFSDDFQKTMGFLDPIQTLKASVLIKLLQSSQDLESFQVNLEKMQAEVQPEQNRELAEILEIIASEFKFNILGDLPERDLKEIQPEVKRAFRKGEFDRGKIEAEVAAWKTGKDGLEENGGNGNDLPVR